MNSREEIGKGLVLYCCCVLVFACVVMLGSQLNVVTRVVDLLILPAVAIVYHYSNTSPVMKWFEIFPHFGSQGLPFLYGALFFSPLIGYAFRHKPFWIRLQGAFAAIHVAVVLLWI